MTQIAVLDDNTADANVIGYASDADSAAEVFMAYMADRMDAADYADLARPDFTCRTDTSVVSPAFEPLF